MSEENKAIVRRWIEELFNEGHLDVADDIVASDHVRHHIQFASLYRSAFPDARITIEDELAAGDKVVTRWTAHGTHRGELRGIAPTGRRVATTGMAIWRIEEGKIAETWSNHDALVMLQQIGALPSVPHG